MVLWAKIIFVKNSNCRDYWRIAICMTGYTLIIWRCTVRMKELYTFCSAFAFYFMCMQFVTWAPKMRRCETTITTTNEKRWNRKQAAYLMKNEKIITVLDYDISVLFQPLEWLIKFRRFWHLTNILDEKSMATSIKAIL